MAAKIPASRHVGYVLFEGLSPHMAVQGTYQSTACEPRIPAFFLLSSSSVRVQVHCGFGDAENSKVTTGTALLNSS